MREQGMTYKEIAKAMGTNRSIIWKMIAWEIPSMRIGIKSRISTREITPIWEHIPPEQFIDLVKRLVRNIQSEREIIIDILFRFFYSRNEYFLEKLDKIDSLDGKIGFLFRCGKMEILHYYSHRDERKMIKFSIDKYDAEKIKQGGYYGTLL